MVKNVRFDKSQLKYLENYFEERNKAFLNEVKKQSFNGEDADFKDLCEKIYNVSEMKQAKIGSKKSKKKRTPTGFFKYLYSNDGIPKMKQDPKNKNLKQPALVSLVSKNWRKMSDGEKKNYN